MGLLLVGLFGVLSTAILTQVFGPIVGVATVICALVSAVFVSWESAKAGIRPRRHQIASDINRIYENIRAFIWPDGKRNTPLSVTDYLVADWSLFTLSAALTWVLYLIGAEWLAYVIFGTGIALGVVLAAAQILAFRRIARQDI